MSAMSVSFLYGLAVVMRSQGLVVGGSEVVLLA